MKRYSWLPLGVFLFVLHQGFSQDLKTGPGIGIYPTGTETGIGYRSSRTNRWAIDTRITKANAFTEPKGGTLINEASWIYRIAYYERVRFYADIGARADWNFDKSQSHRFGVVTPLGVEAFPFPFQNAGLFFEAEPFVTRASSGNVNVGIRTVAGFVFYLCEEVNILAAITVYSHTAVN